MRVNFNYFIPEEVFSFLVEAVHFIAVEGWKLLPLYDFEAETGLWHHSERPQQAALGFDDLSYLDGGLDYDSVRLTEPISILESYLDQAREVVAGIESSPQIAEQGTALSDELESLRWFPLP